MQKSNIRLKNIKSKKKKTVGDEQIEFDLFVSSKIKL